MKSRISQQPYFAFKFLSSAHRDERSCLWLIYIQSDIHACPRLCRTYILMPTHHIPDLSLFWGGCARLRRTNTTEVADCGKRPQGRLNLSFVASQVSLRSSKRTATTVGVHRVLYWSSSVILSTRDYILRDALLSLQVCFVRVVDTQSILVYASENPLRLRV